MPRRPAVRAPVSRDDEQAVAGGWLHGIRFSGFSFLMMGILVLAVVVLAPSLRTYVEQRQQVDRLAAAVDDAKEHVEELTEERERWNDRTYITTQARDRLSYVLPGDISFLVINDLPQPTDASEQAPVSTGIQDTRVDWLHSMFASVMTAGLAPETAPQ